MANLPDALFCSHCGASLDAPRQPQRIVKESLPKADGKLFALTRKAILLISIAIVLVVVIAIVWASIASGSNNSGDMKNQNDPLASPSLEFGSPVPAAYTYQKEIRTLQVDLPINSVSEPIQLDNVSISVSLEGWNGSDSQWSINTSSGDYFSHTGAEPESVGYQIVREAGNDSQWDYMALEFISYGDQSINIGDHLRLTSNDFRLDANGTSIPAGYWTITIIDKGTGDAIASTSFDVLEFA